MRGLRSTSQSPPPLWVGIIKDVTVSDDAPGWDAITAAMEGLYPDQTTPAAHLGSDLHARVVFGGPEAVDGFSCYRAVRPVEHWHWVTYGLSALYDKPEGEDSEWSGWGYEMTMRAAPVAGRQEPDDWPVRMLRGLANYAHSEGIVFQPQRCIRLGVRRPDGQPAEIVGFGFYEDPLLPTIATPHGKVDFVELVGLTAPEMTVWKEQGPDVLFDLAGQPWRSAFNDPLRGSFV